MVNVRDGTNPGAALWRTVIFTIEELEADIAARRVFQDCFWKSFKLSMAPNGLKV